MHYDTHENNFDFESVSPDNPFNEEDDGKIHLAFLSFQNCVRFFIYELLSILFTPLAPSEDEDDAEVEDEEDEGDEDDE